MPSVEDLKICYVNYNIDRECVATIFKVSSQSESGYFQRLEYFQRIQEDSACFCGMWTKVMSMTEEVQTLLCGDHGSEEDSDQDYDDTNNNSSIWFWV